MIWGKSKRIRELEHQLMSEEARSEVLLGRYRETAVRLVHERKEHRESLRSISIEDLQVVFDALERYRETMNERCMPDPYQAELSNIYEKHNITPMTKNRNNS